MRRLTCARVAPLAATVILLLGACSLSQGRRGGAPASADGATQAAAAGAAADPSQLRRQLAERDKDLATLKTEVSRLREREAASRQALDTLKRMLQARAALPYSLTSNQAPGSPAP